MDAWWSSSRQLVIFWLCFITGVIIGSHIQLPLTTLVWLTALWLLIFISGQNRKIEILSLLLTGAGAGIILWQLTEGESWLKIGLIDNFSRWLISFRDTVIEKIFLTLPEPHGSLLAGTLFGNRIKLDKDLIDIFRTVGLSHLIAVSGYNLSILTANVMTLFRPILGRKTIFLAATLIASFVLLSGAPASILRAAVMAGVVLLAEYLGRPRHSIIALISAAGLLVLFQPKIIFDVGFQLSLAATYGLVRLTPLFEHTLRNIRIIPEPIRRVISETLAATFLTTPIIIASFERLSLVSPLTNVLVVPIMPLVMGIGIIGVILLLTVPPVGSYIIWLTWPLLSWIIIVSEKANTLHWAATDVSITAFWASMLMLGLIIGAELASLSSRKLQEKELRLY
jgi:competence protein ComEC